MVREMSANSPYRDGFWSDSGRGMRKVRRYLREFIGSPEFVGAAICVGIALAIFLIWCISPASHRV